MKIVVLTSDTSANVWLVNQLLAQHDVVGMVIERPSLAVSATDKIERRRRMIKRYGWLRTLNKLAFNRVRSRGLADFDADAIRRGLFTDNAPVEYSRDIPTAVVGNINDPECIRFIRDRMPTILAVCGTTVLKPEVFTLAPKGAINIHTGITPEYRSADPIFWALYRGEPEKVGVTIHFIDRGIDTGSIIHQDVVTVYADDSLATIYVRCVRRGAELYSKALRAIGDGSVRTISRSGVQSRAFLSVDLGLVQYLTFRWRFWRLASKLPRHLEVPKPSLSAGPR